MAYDFPETLTQSKLTAFSCPARYKKLHVEGLSDTSDPARRGSTVHRANEIYIQALVDAGMPSDADAAMQAFAQAVVDENTPAHLVPECEGLWRGWVEKFELDVGAFLEAEQRQTVGRFSFKPDYAYATPDALEVHDLKTHFQGLTEKAAKADLQARMSAFLASRVWPGFPVYRFVFHFVRLFMDVAVEFTPADMDAIEAQLESHAEAIRQAELTGNYPAAPGQLCSFCTFQCPMVDDASRMPVRFLTRADAEKAAQEVLVLRQALSAKMKAVEAYCDIRGPVVVNGMEFSHRPTESLSFPAADVVDVLRSYQADTSALTLGKTALKSWLVAKKNAHIRPHLEILAKAKAGTRFSVKKQGAVGDDEEA